jgi:hypothetical protein
VGKVSLARHQAVGVELGGALREGRGVAGLVVIDERDLPAGADVHGRGLVLERLDGDGGRLGRRGLLGTAAAGEQERRGEGEGEG